MVRLFYACILGLMALLVGACSPNGEIELTLVNQNVALSTEIADVRNTATYAADELNITAEYVQTAVLKLTQDRQLLAATLSASGLDPSNVTPGAPIPTQVIPAQGVVPAGSTPLPAGNTISGASPDALVTPTIPPDPSLYNIVTASGVGANDCALGSVTNFTSLTTQIYVVATAASIAPNTRLSSQWFREGVLVVSHEFTPDFFIEQNCIWFYIDQADTPFTPGNWSVQVAINDQPAGAPVAFTITE